MIRVENLVKTFTVGKREIHALNGVSFCLPQKGMVFVVGKSGSGKSTLLNMISGFVRPTSGTIFVGDKEITALRDEEMDNYRATCLGFIFQDFHLVESLSVGENVRLALSIKGETNGELVAKMLELVDLAGYEHRRVTELSGGECQRVAIARSLVKNPKIILADEPTGNLDSKTSTQILKTLKAISQNNLVVIVSHNIDDAYNYGDRIIELKDGQIIADKTKGEGYQNEFCISDGIVTLPHKKALTAEQTALFNKCAQQGEVKQIVQLTDGFSPTAKTSEERIATSFEKSKLLGSEARSLTKNLFKGQRVMMAVTVALITLLITLFGFLQSFMSFDTQKVMDDVFANYPHQAVVVKQGVYNERKHLVDTNYYVPIGDFDWQSTDYKGNCYNLYSLAIQTQIWVAGVACQKPHNPTENVATFFALETVGVLVTDKQFLNNTLANGDNVNVLAGDINGDVGIIITDYIADAILRYQPKLYGSYQDLLGNYSIQNMHPNVVRCYIKAIVDTDYETRHKYVYDTMSQPFTADSPVSYAEFINSDEFLRFVEDVHQRLAVTYSFDENFINTLVDNGARQRTHVGSADIYLNGVPVTQNWHLDIDLISNPTLADNQIVMSMEKYNAIFGTNYNTTTMSAFAPHEITINVNNNYKALDDTPVKEYTLQVVALNSDLADICCNINLYKDFINTTITPYALYFDAPEQVGALHQSIKKANCYINLDSYVTADNISQIIVNFEDLFVIIIAVVIAVSVLIVAHFANTMISNNKQNIGILRALGVTNGDVLKVFALQLLGLCIIIAMATTLCYLAFVNMGNAVLVEIFLRIFKVEFISTLTLIEAHPLVLLADLGVVFAITAITILLQTALLKRIDVIKIIKSQE